ncbi:MAG: DNA-directed RNA polymerase subunit beta, partial [Deltaproteobacteria bacterium CG_4_10_14_0_2_um_filter_43_8]
LPLLLDEQVTVKVSAKNGEVLLAKGDKLTEEVLNHIPFEEWIDLSVRLDDKKEAEFQTICRNANDQMKIIKTAHEQKIDRLTKGDELPPGVIKMVKVYVAIKRKLSIGDKMAGRHGNKGVVSCIMPEEDLPYMADGTPVDVVLNPLGVPSRMNVGQILETHLGWASYHLGEQINHILEEQYSRKNMIEMIKKAYNSPSLSKLLDESTDEQIRELAVKLRKGVPVETPVFDGANEKEVKSLLETADLPLSGQTILFDGRTGDAFDSPVTVGIMYVLKLHHLVDEKIHARSIGPYSLVTQQPLGGKAQFGGQRLGEMEVWAMEAYGAAYALQEFLTVKSDDVSGRSRMYEAIVKGEKVLEPGLPESFNVLIKELQGLCLDIDLIESEKE